MTPTFEIDEGDLRINFVHESGEDDWSWMEPSGHLGGLAGSVKTVMDVVQSLDAEARRRKFGPYAPREARVLPTPPDGWVWKKHSRLLTSCLSRGSGSVWVEDGKLAKNDVFAVPLDVVRCVLKEYDSRPK